ncbi:low specificity L-threonine aldolase [soil metagenome]
MIHRYDFASDNTAPVAPEAMAALSAANTGYSAAYGEDEISARAADMIRALLDADAEVRFVPSGTAANAVALAALCRPFEAVLAHEHAHVCTNETGAPGYFGQGLGLIGLPGASGKIDPTALNEALERPHDPHHQSPGALSLTNATEYGAVYSAAEVASLSAAAQAKGYGVHLDGARLANAAAFGFDLTSIAPSGVDILVFGGAKAGMTPTEAIVIFDPAIAGRFDARLKQAGQLPSKGRYYAAPFIGMLEDGALMRHAAHANGMAQRLAQLAPQPILHPVESNAVFLDMGAEALEALLAKGWHVYRVGDGSVRFICSWATTSQAVEEIAADLKSLA